jgi:hypothetical protein
MNDFNRLKYSVCAKCTFDSSGSLFLERPANSRREVVSSVSHD